MERVPIATAFLISKTNFYTKFFEITNDEIQTGSIW